MNTGEVYLQREGLTVMVTASADKSNNGNKYSCIRRREKLIRVQQSIFLLLL